MEENDYFKEIENNIKSLEVSKKVRYYQDNNETLLTYWTVGKLLVEAQGREARAKYGNELIKKWASVLVERYGKGYDYSNLQRFKQFYLTFEKGGPVGHQLTWSHIRYILPIKDENERNYYINQVIENHLSIRDLRNSIKNDFFRRLTNVPEHIEIVNSKKILPKDKMMNPIIINLFKNQPIKNEHELEVIILSQLSFFLNQLGDDYLLKANQYKVMIDGKYRYIDILFFNLEMNCYVVVELKLRKIKEQDVGQIKLYMDAIDKKLKKSNQNSTIGIIISKENDKLVANFIKNNNLNIYSLMYEINEVIN